MLYDILFALDQEGRFASVSWGSREAEDLYRDLFESWTGGRRTPPLRFRRERRAAGFFGKKTLFTFNFFRPRRAGAGSF